MAQKNDRYLPARRRLATLTESVLQLGPVIGGGGACETKVKMNVMNYKPPVLMFHQIQPHSQHRVLLGTTRPPTPLPTPSTPTLRLIPADGLMDVSIDLIRLWTI